MNFQTCYDCGAIYDADMESSPIVTTHQKWHYDLDQIVSDLQTDIEYLQRELDGKVDSDG